MESALRNWIEGDANRLVKYGANGGIDAWRRLYAEYIPLAQTKQDIIFTEILDMKPVNDKNVRKLMNRIEELQYKYNQCGGQPLGSNIVKRVMMKCLPKDVTKPLALHLDTATTFQQMRKLVVRQMHDEMTGMLEGDHTQLLYHVNQDMHSEQPTEEQPLHPDLEIAENNWTKAEQEYWAAALGQKGKGGKGGEGKGSKSRGKGYGECWNCGQQGHPARECPIAGKMHGGVGAKDDNRGSNTAAAFKGKGGYKGNNNWNGKVWKGKGEGGGKKSLNLASDTEYNVAWGGGGQEDGDYQHYYEQNNEYNYVVAGKWSNGPATQQYSMMLTRSKPVITTWPKYFPIVMLGEDDEDSDDDEAGMQDEDSTNSNCNCTAEKMHNQAVSKIKKKIGEVNCQNKKTARCAHIPHIGEGSHQAQHRMRPQSRPLQSTRPQVQPQPRPRQPTRPQLQSQSTQPQPRPLQPTQPQIQSQHVQHAKTNSHEHIENLRSRRVKQHSFCITHYNNTTTRAVCIDSSCIGSSHSAPGASTNCIPPKSIGSPMGVDNHHRVNPTSACSIVSAAGLSAELASTSTTPREWQLRRGEVREVMSPHDGPLVTQLSHVPRALREIAESAFHYSNQEVVRDHLVACPSKCTCAPRLIVNGAYTGALHSADAQAQLISRGSPQTPRCQAQERGARPGALVVAADDVDRLQGRREGGDVPSLGNLESDKVSQEELPSTSYVHRRPLQSSNLQSDQQGPGVSGVEVQNVAPHLGRLRGETPGVVGRSVGPSYASRPCNLVRPRRSSTAATSQSLLSSHVKRDAQQRPQGQEGEEDRGLEGRMNVPDGYVAYMKRRPGECEKRAKFHQTSTCPPKQDFVRAKFWDFRKRAILGSRGDQNGERAKNTSRKRWSNDRDVSRIFA